MSRHQPSHEGAPDAPGDVRALPARPNLEFERKQAKKLLRQLRQGDAEALQRVHAKLRHSVETKPDEFQLADAQFAIAREYGFTSWPRLVEYFETLARHEMTGSRELHTPLSHHEGWARAIVAEHRSRRAWTVQMLTAYVPRLYGRTAEEVFATEITIDEAKLTAARMERYPSWEVMVGKITPYDVWTEYDAPQIHAMRLLRAGDLEALMQLVELHPELLSPAEWPGHVRSATLARSVLFFDDQSATPDSRRVVEWLRERIDLTETLNWMLLGHMRMETGDMQRLLDLGADPNWVPPNGYTVLEHVIWRCWNGEVVDLIARRVKPRKAFWIAAGLGDVKAIKRYVDVNGTPTAAARRNRPDFTALGQIPSMPQNPMPDDEEIVWEAFMVAALNQRFNVLDVLLDRGFNIDFIRWGQTMQHLAVGNGWLPLVEYLVKRGANPDLKGWRPHMTARELAEEHFLNPHSLPNAQRILELVGGRDPGLLRRERAQQRARQVMATSRSVEQAFEYAKQDTVAMGGRAVNQDNLLIGMLRQDGLTVSLLGSAGVELKQLRAALRDRLERPPLDVPAEMTANPEVASILMDASELAEQRKEDGLTNVHVLHALVRRASPTVMNLIGSGLVTREKLLESIERVLPPRPTGPDELGVHVSG